MNARPKVFENLSSRRRTRIATSPLAITVAMFGLVSVADGSRPARTSHAAEAARLLAEAKSEYANSKYAEATRHLTAAVELAGPDGELYWTRGSAWLRLGEWTKADDDFRRALALGMNLPAVHISRAKALAKMNRVEEAIQSYSTAIGLRPGDPVPWKDRALLYLSAGRTREGTASLDEAIRLKSDFAEAWALRGSAYLEAGDTERAMVNLSRAITLNPKDYHSYSQLASARFRLGEYRDAVAGYTRALEGEPASADLYLQRAAAYVALGEHELALADRERAVRLRPDLPEAWLARGASYHQLGQHDQGFADRTHAIRLNPNLAEAWFARGSAYYLLGEYRKALADLSKALELRPGYLAARQVMDRVRVRVLDDVLQEQRNGTVVARAAPDPPAATAPRSVPPDSVPAKPAASPPPAAAAEQLSTPRPLPSRSRGESATASTAIPAVPVGPPSVAAEFHPAESGSLAAKLDSLTTFLARVLDDHPQDATVTAIDPATRWVAFSGRVDRTCGVIGTAAMVFAEVLSETPAMGPPLRRAGDAVSRACLVRGESTGVPTPREQAAMEAAFESLLNQSLENLRPAAAGVRRVEGWRKVASLSGASGCILALLAGAVQLRRKYWCRRVDSMMTAAPPDESRGMGPNEPIITVSMRADSG